MMIIENKFEIGDIVYLTTDEDQKRRVVTAITVLPDNKLTYQISCGHFASDHYEFEISDEKNVLAE